MVVSIFILVCYHDITKIICFMLLAMTKNNYFFLA